MLLTETQSKRARVGAVLGLIVMALICTLYLAGYFFLWRIKLPAYTATPFTVYQYWAAYNDVPKVMETLKWCLIFSAVISFGMFGALLIPAQKKLYGDARFAKTKEIKDAGYLGSEGLILGKHNGNFVMLPGQVGALLAAEPRSGKGRGVVQPNMLNWPDSVVITDIRQESYRLTSGFRSKYSEVFLFNPLSKEGMTCQYNPFDYVTDTPEGRVDDIQKIANYLSPDPAQGDPFWPAACRTLFLGLALYIFETEGMPRTFGEVVRQIMYGEGETVGERWKKIIEERDASGKPLSSTCKSALYDFIYTSGNTQASIRKTFTAKLELWLNPLIDSATSSSSFDLRDFRKRRISLYIGIRPGDLERLELLNNLLVQQIIDLNTELMPEDAPDVLKYKCAFFLDEFTALGRMNVFTKCVSFMGGYNLIPFIIIHGPSQLRSVYGHDDAATIIRCLGARVCFAPKDIEEAGEISKALGDTTVKGKSINRPTMGGKSSVTISDNKRALLLPDEVKKIGKKREIIFSDINPILCEKIFYDKEKVFRKRLLPAHAFDPIEIVIRDFIIPNEAVEREEIIITDKNISIIDDLSLADFDIAFEDVEIPTGDNISDEDMQLAVNSFLSSMKD
ncbi:TraM recognition domain-containing protein [Salmonella enterica]|nr:TraM recognition domain-containing protein [Salmonella enterica]